MPIKKGIAAIHYPSIKQQCQEHGGDLYKLLTDIAKKNPLYSLILGQSLENIFNNYKKSPTNLEQCTSILDFGNLVIAPLATLLTLKIISIAKQNGYNNIYYASRDGWLLYQIHKSIEIFIDAPKAIYFQAGRRAYYPFIEPSFLEYVKKQPVKNKEFITVSDIIKIYFNKEAKSLISKLTYEEQKTKFFFNFSYTEKIFKKIENEIIAFMNYKRECALKYYNSIFSSNEGKVLIFDIGYSGSISIALSKILKKPVDKVYCWQTNENIKRDSQNNTKTFVLMEQPDEYSPFNLVLEELFSPCIGGTIDFDNEGNPIHEKLEISNEMLNTLELLHKQCVKYAISTINNFSDYSIFLSNARQDPALKLYKQLFQIKPFNNRTIFNSIVFPDPIYLSESLSLEQKIDNFSSHETSLTATGFEEYKNILHPQTLCYITNNFRTAIHVHIFNPLLAQEISSYLYNIHTDFDLFITYVNNNDIDFFKKIFNSTVIKHIKNVHFIQTPNRGRDIAPWIIATAEVQKNYDLFCHIHAKESKYFKNGKEWRRYLLDNLLRPEALNTIFAAFSQNSKLGMLFPAIFPEIRNTIITNNLSLGTSTTKEYELIIKLLKRMKLSPTYSRSEQFYSCGTMFWYRPQALNLLFDCGIKYEDFPPEPIETGGTLAHALERIPPILCKRSGYDVRSLTIYKNKVTT